MYSMCQLQLLSDCEKGYVAKCSQCNGYMLVFNDLHRMFSAADYRNFKSYILNFNAEVFLIDVLSATNREVENGSFSFLQIYNCEEDLELLQNMICQATLLEDALQILA